MFHKLRLLALALSSIFYSLRKQKPRGSKDLSKAREQIRSEYCQGRLLSSGEGKWVKIRWAGGAGLGRSQVVVKPGHELMFFR